MLPGSDLTLNLMLALSAIIGYLIYVYKNRYMFWERMGVPSLGFWGDTILDFKRHHALAIQDQYNKMASHPYFGSYRATKPILVIRDPELIKNILIRDFSHFTDHGMDINEKLDPLHANIFRLGGQRWKNIRTKLTPAFSAGKLKAMFPLIEDCTNVLEGYLTDRLKEKSDEFEVLELMLKFSMDVIGTCTFGIKCNTIADEESEFSCIRPKLLSNSFRNGFRTLFRAIHPKIIAWLGWKDFDQEVDDFFMSLTRDTIRHREENQDKRNDFMQLLINIQHEEQRMLEEQKAGTEPLFSDHVVAAQVFVLFFAGHEAVAVTLTNCLYELALNPDIMDKVHAEIQQVLDAHGGKLDFDALKEMQYMECVVSVVVAKSIKEKTRPNFDEVLNDKSPHVKRINIIPETLRKYPTDACLLRTCTNAYEFPDSHLLIKENTMVIIPTHSLHYDPQYFPEPDKFDPDRFNGENKTNIISGTYLPFGDGPRICIGSRFAIIVLRAALSSIIRNYTVHPTNQTQIPWKMAKSTLVIARPQGIHLRFQKRVN